MITLDKDEKILLKVRKHWIVLVGEATFLILPVIMPFLIVGLLEFLDVARVFTFTGDGTALVIFISSLWLLFVWVIFFMIWTDYYLDILIVTNKHVIDVEQRGLFTRELSTFRLDRIQDVTAEMDGIIQTVFNYGVIHIQTAGEGREFIMHGVPSPFQIKNFISEHHDVSIEKLRTVHLSQDSIDHIKEA